MSRLAKIRVESALWRGAEERLAGLSSSDGQELRVLAKVRTNDHRCQRGVLFGCGIIESRRGPESDRDKVRQDGGTAMNPG